MEKFALPKSFGGWELKNIFLFSMTLAVKNVWRLIQGTCLCVQVVRVKYTTLDTMED
jgi:hypothetical protein